MWCDVLGRKMLCVALFLRVHLLNVLVATKFDDRVVQSLGFFGSLLKC